MDIIDISSSSPEFGPTIIADDLESGSSQPSTRSSKGRSKSNGRKKGTSPSKQRPPKPNTRSKKKTPVTRAAVDVIDIDSDTSEAEAEGTPEQSADSDFELHVSPRGTRKSKGKGRVQNDTRSPSVKRTRAQLESRFESDVGTRPPAKKARLSEARSIGELSFESEDGFGEDTSSDGVEVGSPRGRSAPTFGRATALLRGVAADAGEGAGADVAVTQDVPRMPGAFPTRARTPLFLPDDDSSPHKSSPSRAQTAARTPSRRSVPPHRVVASQPEAGPSKAPKPRTKQSPILQLAPSSPHGPDPEPEIVEVEVIPGEDEPESIDSIARILEIVPDVDPAHAETLIARYTATHASEPERVVELTLHALLEDPGYPKAPKGKDKGKGREVDVGGEASGSGQGPAAGNGGDEGEVDYMQKDRPEHPGPLYLMHAVEQLALDFPLIPKLHVRGRLNENKGFYVPTYYVLLADETSPTPPYTRKRTASKQANRQKHVNDEAFDREHGWLIVKLDNERVAKDAEEAERIADEEAIAAGEGVECGCCFAEYPIHKMAQCPEAHLFCTICLGSYASNLLGEHNPALRCMDQSGCTALFSEDTLSCVLTPKLMELYHRVKQRKEIEAAGLEGLEECPFCEYKCVIENPEEKLFRCERRECGAVSCRGCQKLDHVPRSCKEMEEDKHLNARHTVEEAMTAALMRNCPKCNKAFIKEMGCNKMTCPDCRTISCYTCREVIRGYDHFSNGKKCNLWDSLDGTAGPDRRHEAEVAAAREKALEQYRKDHPDADAHELKAVEVQLAVPGGSKNAGRSGVHQRVPQAAQGMQHVGQRIRDAEHLMQEAMQQAEQRLQQAEQRIRQARRERQQQQLVQNAAGVPMVGLRPEFLRGAGVNMDFGELGAGGGLNFGMNWGAAVPPPVAPHLPIFDHPFAPPPPPMNGAAYMERLGIFPPAGGQGLRDGQAHAPAHAVHRRGRGNHNRRRQNR